MDAPVSVQVPGNGETAKPPVNMESRAYNLNRPDYLAIDEEAEVEGLS